MALLETNFNKQTQDMQSLQNEKARLAFEVRGLRIRVSQTKSRLKAAEDSSLEKDKQIVVLGMDKEEPIGLLRAQEQELEALKSTNH